MIFINQYSFAELAQILLDLSPDDKNIILCELLHGILDKMDCKQAYVLSYNSTCWISEVSFSFVIPGLSEGKKKNRLTLLQCMLDTEIMRPPANNNLCCSWE